MARDGGLTGVSMMGGKARMVVCVSVRACVRACVHVPTPLPLHIAAHSTLCTTTDSLHAYLSGRHPVFSSACLTCYGVAGGSQGARASPEGHACEHSEIQRWQLVE